MAHRFNVYYDDAKNTLELNFNETHHEIKGFIIFGSVSSGDYDIIYIIPTALQPMINDSYGISTTICKKLEQYSYAYVSKHVYPKTIIEDKDFDPMFCTIEGGYVTWCSKSHYAEANNSIYATFNLHPQMFEECPVKGYLERDKNVILGMNVWNSIRVIIGGSFNTHNNRSVVSYYYGSTGQGFYSSEIHKEMIFFGIESFRNMYKKILEINPEIQNQKNIIDIRSCIKTTKNIKNHDVEVGYWANSLISVPILAEYNRNVLESFNIDELNTALDTFLKFKHREVRLKLSKLRNSIIELIKNYGELTHMIIDGIDYYIQLVEETNAASKIIMQHIHKTYPPNALISDAPRHNVDTFISTQKYVKRILGQINKVPGNFNIDLAESLRLLETIRISSFRSKNEKETIEKLKIFAFKLGIAKTALDHKHCYTKEAIAEAEPLLSPFLFRMEITDERMAYLEVFTIEIVNLMKRFILS